MTTCWKMTARPKTLRLEQLLGLVERALRGVVKPASGSPHILDDAIRYCVLSTGKRFRPLLCLGACEAVGGDVRTALPVACSIELIHTYSLVHDDLPAMDDADQRRGQPSCHRRFGEAAAILVGDALLTRAFELLGSNGTPQALAIIRILAQASGTTGLIGGQVLDLDLGGKGHGARGTARSLEEVARRKTAALITASVVAGGLTGTASPKELAHLRQYGMKLGLAFQLMDDLHDRDGLVRIRGPEAVRQRAAQLIAQANRALLPFKRRAWVLHELADRLAKA